LSYPRPFHKATCMQQIRLSPTAYLYQTNDPEAAVSGPNNSPPHRGLRKTASYPTTNPLDRVRGCRQKPRYLVHYEATRQGVAMPIHSSSLRYAISEMYFVAFGAGYWIWMRLGIFLCIFNVGNCMRLAAPLCRPTLKAPMLVWKLRSRFGLENVYVGWRYRSEPVSSSLGSCLFPAPNAPTPRGLGSSRGIVGRLLGDY
jgi:hypothetical protein